MGERKFDGGTSTIALAKQSGEPVVPIWSPVRRAPQERFNFFGFFRSAKLGAGGSACT